MRKLFQKSLLLLILPVCFSCPDSVSAKEGIGIVKSDNGLFIRKENSLKSERMASLSDKEEVIIIGKTKNWYKIKYELPDGSKFGFVLRKFVEIKKEDGKVEEKKTENTDKKDKKSKKDKKETKKTDKTSDTKSEDKKEKDKKKKEDAKNDKKKKNEEAETDQKKKKKAEENNIETTENNAVQKKYQSVIVAADLLNVREEESIKSSIIATVRALETYPIVSMTDEWVKISLTKETQGYVMREYVDFSVLESRDGHEVIPETQEEPDNTPEPVQPQVLLHASDVEFTPLVNKIAVLNAPAVNVRRDTNLESPILAMLLQGVRLEATGDSQDWIRVSIDDDQGYIMKPYAQLEDGVLIKEEIPEGIYIAKTEEEIRKPTGADGQAVVDFAKQFLGNPYSWGGCSLTDGADCSGFVQTVYKHFGYHLRRTSRQQRNDGVAVPSLSEAMPGDLICYEGHVGIFAGHGVGLIHASNKTAGIIITRNPSYRPIVAIRRIIY